MLFQGVGALQVVGVFDRLHLVLQLLQPLTLFTGLLQHHDKQHGQQPREPRTEQAHPLGEGGGHADARVWGKFDVRSVL